MRPRRGTVFGIMLGALLLAAPSAIAAAPSNDTSSGALPINALPYVASVDTTQATTDADDAAANANCGAPATDASVWYKVTLDTATDILVDVSGSDYSAGVIVSAGTISNVITCGPQIVEFFADAGTDYYLLIFDDQLDGSGNGGTLSLNVDVTPPPPDVTLTVNRAGGFNAKDGTAIVSGTASCTGDHVDFFEVDGNMRQNVGRFAITGSFFAELVCDGATHDWSAIVYPDNGKFGGGRAQVGAFAFACNIVTCGEADAFQTVTLKGKK
jgi:Family of unknown function (DUF6299)